MGDEEKDSLRRGEVSESELEDGKLKSIVPWGRSLEEYQKMFNLREEWLENKRILDIGGGPASFNGQLPGQVTSVDPIYSFTPEEIAGQIEETKAKVANFVDSDTNAFVWGEKTFLDSEHLVRHRCRTMAHFLEDYKKPSSRGRYISGTALKLPFPDKSFDIALSSHFLVLYSPLLGEQFHVKAMKELIRVSKEVRIFPLVDTNFTIPTWTIKSMRVQAEEMGMKSVLVNVACEFQKGANEMMRVFNPGNEEEEENKTCPLGSTRVKTL